MTTRCSIARALALVAALAVAVGCAGRADDGPRVRLYDGGDSGQDAQGADTGARGGRAAKEPGAVPVTVSDSGSHIVRRGQTLYAIARAYGAPLRALITENDLEPPYQLTVGQRLAVPQARVHEVAAGDTVYGISRQYGVSMNELVRRNDIRSPYTITVGQRLLIPGAVTGGGAGSRTAANGGTGSERREESENRVARATPDDAAREAGSDGASDAPPDAADIAARLRRALDEPGADATAPSTEDASAEGSGDGAETTAETSLPDRPFRVTDAGFPRPRAKPEAPRVFASIAQPPARAASRFLWPIQGRVVSGFGAKGEGLHNDGLNIAAPRGAPVRAAENGVVAYSGRELAGFGNGVLVKHADGFMTFYAHNGEVLVQRGQRVARGQTIARVGSSGNVDSPQLHFQIRKGRRALDPKRLLDG